MKNIYKKIIVGVVATLSFTACTVEEFSNLNSPDLNDILADPSLGDIQDLLGGVQASMRTRLGTYYDDVGVIGREFYRFASSDPRFTGDLLGRETSVLDNNTFYITGPWGARYGVVKSTNIVLEAVDITDADITDAERNAIRGFAQTIQAYELLLNLNLTYQNGIRVDVSNPNDLGPVLGYDASLAAIQSLLGNAASNLAAGGTTFPFELNSGYDDLDSTPGDNEPLTPSDFLTFTNAIAARVAAYQGDLVALDTFLSNSFMDLAGDLDTGAHYVFSSDGNDIFNPVFFALNSSTAGARIAHPDFVPDAAAGDTRVSKVVLRGATLTLDGLSGDYDFYAYTSNTAPIPIIRNEELILLFAEANHISNPGAAVMAIDRVRTSAGLAPYAGGLTPEDLVNEILMQRRYSLYGEGHRWIDMRRFDRLDQLPIDRPGDDVWEQFPIPLNENE